MRNSQSHDCTDFWIQPIVFDVTMVKEWLDDNSGIDKKMKSLKCQVMFFHPN